MQQKQPKVRPGLTLTDKSRLGDITEHVVITEALKRGAEVYKNCSCTGSTDLIIEHKGRVLQVDVKTEKMDLETGNWKSVGVARAKKPRVIVNPETWKCRWVRGKTPPGWETFWN